MPSASTALMLALRTNEPIQKAVLTLRKAGKTQLEYLKVTIEQGRVTALTVDAGDLSGSPDVVERVSFSFNKIEIEYVPQGKDGQPQGGMTFADQWSDAV
jgi:type VI secretion system secreted protein Hcp